MFGVGVGVGWTLRFPPALDPPLRWTTLRRTAQNFALFFSPSPASIFALFVSVCLLVEFWWCFEAPGPSNAPVGSSWAVVWGPAAPKPPGFHTTARETRRAHLRVPFFTKTTKIEREDTEREEERKWSERRKKKDEILGGSGSAEGGPNQQQQHQHEPQQQTTTNNNKQPHNNNQTTQHNHTTTHNWPKMDCAKLDWSKLAKPHTTNH